MYATRRQGEQGGGRGSRGELGGVRGEAWRRVGGWARESLMKEVGREVKVARRSGGKRGEVGRMREVKGKEREKCGRGRE